MKSCLIISISIFSKYTTPIDDSSLLRVYFTIHMILTVTQVRCKKNWLEFYYIIIEFEGR